MRIYNRMLFIVGLLCGLCAIHAWKQYESTHDIIWIAFFLYMMIRTIWGSCLKPKETGDERKS